MGFSGIGLDCLRPKSMPKILAMYFLINLLKEGPQTIEEIIDAAIKQSGGSWKPTSRQVRALLEKLLDDGLAEKAEDGRYGITEDGRTTSEGIREIKEAAERKLGVLFTLASVDKSLIPDLLDRFVAVGYVLGISAGNMTEEQRSRYRQILKDELEKIQEDKEIDDACMEIKVE